MITLNIILVLLVLVVAFFLFFKLLKGVVKAIIAVLFLILFVTAILGVVIYFDVVKVKNSIDKEQTILLSHKGAIVAGFAYDNSGDNKVLQSDKLQLLNKEEISSISKAISGGTYTSKDGGFTIVIDSSEFQDSSIALNEFITINMSEELVDSIFTCEDTSSCIDLVVDVAPSLKKQIQASFEDEQDLKNKLFFNLFADKSSKTNGVFIISGIRNKQVSIYPQLTTVKLLQMMPEKLVDFAIKKSVEAAASSMKSQIESQFDGQ